VHAVVHEDSISRSLFLLVGEFEIRSISNLPPRYCPTALILAFVDRPAIARSVAICGFERTPAVNAKNLDSFRSAGSWNCGADCDYGQEKNDTILIKFELGKHV
jgi:hypothetical protein